VNAIGQPSDRAFARPDTWASPVRSSRISGKLYQVTCRQHAVDDVAFWMALGAGTVSPSEVAIDLPRFLPPVKVPETGFADRRPEPRRSQDTGVPAWKQTYHLPHDLGRTTAGATHEGF
jgi:hypothetical protein